MLVLPVLAGVSITDDGHKGVCSEATLQCAQALFPPVGSAVDQAWQPHLKPPPVTKSASTFAVHF